MDEQSIKKEVADLKERVELLTDLIRLRNEVAELESRLNLQVYPPPSYPYPSYPPSYPYPSYPPYTPVTYLHDINSSSGNNLFVELIYHW